MLCFKLYAALHFSFSAGLNLNYKILDRATPHLYVEGCQFSKTKCNSTSCHEATITSSSDLVSWNVNQSFDQGRILKLAGFKLNLGYPAETGASVNTGNEIYSNDFCFMDYDGQMSMDEMSDICEDVNPK